MCFLVCGTDNVPKQVRLKFVPIFQLLFIRDFVMPEKKNQKCYKSEIIIFQIEFCIINIDG